MGFWWGLMVLNTVGYGSTAPSTEIGKAWGSGGDLMVLNMVGYGATALFTAIGKVLGSGGASWF
jgi:hypothetical protein